MVGAGRKHKEGRLEETLRSRQFKTLDNNSSVGSGVVGEYNKG